MQAHLLSAIEAEPPEMNTADAKQRLKDHFASAHETALAGGVAALGTDRYFRLLDSLDKFLASPPLTSKAHKKAQTRINRFVNAERRRLKAKVKTHHRASDPTSAGAALHEVRKSAKRLRYAAEAAVPIFGKKAARIAKAAEDIQTILGEHQDSVICREKLYSLTTAPPGAEEAKIGFAYGRLHALEQHRAAEARSDFLQVWRASPPKRLHGK